jgi:hypothetical protein
MEQLNGVSTMHLIGSAIEALGVGTVLAITAAAVSEREYLDTDPRDKLASSLLDLAQSDEVLAIDYE